jgi:hypothetical protein
MIKNKSKYLFLSVLLLFTIGAINHYSIYKLELLGYYSKVGAHRVNSIEKLNSAEKYFDIIELDLVYYKENDFMDVNHPPAQSINLKLKNYILAMKGKEKPFLWLDIKNLTENNSTEILNKLQKVFSEFNYPLSKVLVETQYPEALTLFIKNGFKGSYYLPYGLCKMENLKLNETITAIQEVLNKQPDIAISSDIQDYEILVKNFPLKTKYTWTMGNTFRNHFIQTQKALRDPNVDILLVSYKASFGNR